MRIKFSIIILFLIAFSLYACVEEYWPEVEKYENLLVVDGFISNEPGPYTIKLSVSSKIDQPNFDAVTDAKVYIINDLGDSEELTEISNGSYQTSLSGILGEIGRKYMLKIETIDNKQYETGFQELTEPTEIDTVFIRIEEREPKNTYYNQVGYQFYINTKEALKDTCYYFWKLTETWEYNASYVAFFIWDRSPDYWWRGQLYEVNDPAKYLTCWRTDEVNEIFTYSTENLSEQYVMDFPLHYVNTESKRLTKRYSLQVKQYTTTQQAYTYWSKLKSQNIEQGSLYSKQPYQINGNVKNISDPNESVLGFFMVASVSEKRIFVNAIENEEFHYDDCTPDFDGMQFLSQTPRSQWPVFITVVDGQQGIVSDRCADCRSEGGFTAQPGFWIE